MLEIQERFDTQGYEELVGRFAPQNVHITEALEGGKVTGFIAYFYGAEKTTVCGYDDGGDLMLCDGLVRSVLFKSCLKGISKCEFRFDDENKLGQLIKLRFITENSRVAENIDSFMNGCENCKHNNN